MSKKQAMEILMSRHPAEGRLDGKVVYIHPQDVEENLLCGTGNLNLDWIQDFVGINGELVQGHCLAEIYVTSTGL